MKRALLSRYHQDDYCTLGALCDAETRKEICLTLELPDRGNQHGISRIPAATYLCSLRWSEKHNGKRYGVNDVPGRDNIEIHSANVPSELLGCIATGTKTGVINGERGVLNSVDALKRFMAWADGEDVELTITDPAPEVEA